MKKIIVILAGIALLIVKYKKLDVERKALLPESVISLEEYCTRIEGSACYIEVCVYKMQKPQEFCGII